MEKFNFDTSFLGNLVTSFSPEVKKLICTWFIVSLVLVYGKPNWSVITNEEGDHSFFKILLASSFISLIPFAYPYMIKGAEFLKIR